MRSKLAFALALSIAGPGLVATPVLAQKQGGTLRVYHRDNLPSGSIHEEATISTVQPFMGVFNNLVLFDQQKPLNTPETIMPDLADSWAWDATKTKLTFKLHPGWNRLPLGLQRASSLRLLLGSRSNGSASSGGLAEVRIPGVRVSQSLRPPTRAGRSRSSARTRASPGTTRSRISRPMATSRPRST